jgi:hypothetical protein
MAERRKGTMSSSKSLSNLVPPTQQAKQAARLAGTITVGAVMYIVLALVVLHFLRPEYDPVARVISNYAVGPYGFLMTTAFLALAISTLSLAFGIYKGVVPAARSGGGLTLLVVAGLGALPVALFPTDVTPEDLPITTVGTIHVLASVASLAFFVVASLLLSRRLKNDERWSSFQPTLWGFALAGLAAFIAFFVIKALNLPVGGIAQRVSFLTALLWLFLTGNHLRSVHGQSARG